MNFFKKSQTKIAAVSETIRPLSTNELDAVSGGRFAEGTPVPPYNPSSPNPVAPRARF